MSSLNLVSIILAKTVRGFLGVCARFLSLTPQRFSSVGEIGAFDRRLESFDRRFGIIEFEYYDIPH